MRFEDVPFKKPAPNEVTIIRWYNNRKNASVRSKKTNNKSEIHYKREKGGIIKNMITGEKKEYKKREFKAQRRVWRIQKENGEFIRNNFYGLPGEKLLEILFPTPVERNEINKKVKNVRERIQRKFLNTEYIRIILFITPFELVVHIWLKTNDGSPLVIDQAIVDSICNADEKMNVIEITDKNIKQLSSYQYNKRFSQNCYPSNMEICSYSKGIKPVEEEAIIYSKAEEILTGYSPTFQKSKAIFVEVEGEKQIQQQYTFQEFVKNDTEIKEEKKMNEDLKQKIIQEELIMGNPEQEQKEEMEKTLLTGAEKKEIYENLEQIQQLQKQNPNRSFIVIRSDIDQCQIKDKTTKKVRFQANTREVLEAVKELIDTENKNESEEK